jgi:rubredoxin
MLGVRRRKGGSVLNVYRTQVRAVDDYTSGKQLMKRYMCVVCGFIYDEEQGLPEEGIIPGTRWDEIPENWSCPECGAAKSDFEMMEV